MELAVMIMVLFAAVIIDVPIAFALATAPIFYLLVFEKFPLILATQQMFSGVDSFVFLAVPFFILSGQLMESGKISDRLIRFGESLLDRFTGGLAMACAFASMIFASISGSGPATTAAIGGAIMPALIERGYGREWTVALMASAGVIGPIIPPSITMVIYGAMTGTSIGALFIGGIIPGILIGLGLMVISYFHAKKVGVKKRGSGATSILRACLDAKWALGMPIVILGGILGGVFTPTEASVVSVVYALIVCLFIYKTLNFRDLPDIFKRSIITSSLVMIILANASAFAWILTAERGPQKVILLLQGITTNKYGILAIINVLLLVLGCLIDTTSAMIMTVPTLAALGNSVGIDPLHLGLVICINLVIGMATPPVGFNVFTACAIGKVEINQVVKPIFPMIVIMVGVLALVTYLPDLFLFLPRLLLK
jgi:C4-dicarboxylate transporter, DctM subunit